MTRPSRPRSFVLGHSDSNPVSTSLDPGSASQDGCLTNHGENTLWRATVNCDSHSRFPTRPRQCTSRASRFHVIPCQISARPDDRYAALAANNRQCWFEAACAFSYLSYRITRVTGVRQMECRTSAVRRENQEPSPGGKALMEGHKPATCPRAATSSVFASSSVAPAIPNVTPCQTEVQGAHGMRLRPYAASCRHGAGPNLRGTNTRGQYSPVSTSIHVAAHRGLGRSAILFSNSGLSGCDTEPTSRPAI